MAENLSSTTLCSTLTKEWFEDSSSEEEAGFSGNCYHVRLFKKGKTSTSARKSDLLREKDLMVELKNTAVKVEWKVVSKAVLTANVPAGGLKNAVSSTSAVVAVTKLAPSSQSTSQPDHKRKKEWEGRKQLA